MLCASKLSSSILGDASPGLGKGGNLGLGEAILGLGKANLALGEAGGASRLFVLLKER
jgi:hypothetical protein